MKVAKPQEVSNWDFIMINPEGTEITVGPFSTLYILLNNVASYIGVYDGMTDNKYGEKLREEANKVTDGDWNKYLKLMIEHQMCIRNKSIKCWSGGLGDDIHNVISAVEGFVLEKAPAPIQRMAQRAASIVTRGKSRTLSGCSSCGGTAVMNPALNNLGRAGSLNKIGKK